MTVGRIIETQADVDEGAAWLRARVPAFGPVLDATGPWPLRRRGDGFAALLHAIVGQQVSTASAAAIWDRLETAGLTGAECVAEAPDAALLGCGLSRPKLRYARALSQSGLDYAALRGLPDPEAIAALTAITGIGQWTAEIYLLASLGRADIMPSGDLALQESARVVFDLPARPTARELAAMSDDWSPFRSVAARGLWAYYRVVKGREGVR